MSNQPKLKKPQPERTTKQIEANRKLEKSKITSVISSKPKRSQVHGTD